MHRILFAFAALAISAAPAVAEEPQWLTGEIKTITGTIDKPITVFGFSQFATFATSYVETDKGLIQLYFSKQTVFTDANGKVMDAGSWSSPIKKGEKAEIRYGTIQNDFEKWNGQKGAASVHYLTYVISSD